MYQRRLPEAVGAFFERRMSPARPFHFPLEAQNAAAAPAARLSAFQNPADIGQALRVPVEYFCKFYRCNNGTATTAKESATAYYGRKLHNGTEISVK